MLQLSLKHQQHCTLHATHQFLAFCFKISIQRFYQLLINFEKKWFVASNKLLFTVNRRKVEAWVKIDLNTWLRVWFLRSLPLPLQDDATRHPVHVTWTRAYQIFLFLQALWRKTLASKPRVHLSRDVETRLARSWILIKTLQIKTTQRLYTGIFFSGTIPKFLPKLMIREKIIKNYEPYHIGRIMKFFL